MINVASRHTKSGVSHRLPHISWDVLGKNMEITQAQLRELFTYRQDGCLISNKNSTRRKIGDVVGSLHGDNYLTVSINSKNILLHRVIYFYHYGHCPEFLDHINGNFKDNRIENLRPATRSQNMMNRRLAKNNTSGIIGVTWEKSTNSWIAKININGKRTKLGKFTDLFSAACVRKSAEQKHYGEFLRKNL
jgi:hypothetical protein